MTKDKIEKIINLLNDYGESSLTEANSLKYNCVCCMSGNCEDCARPYYDIANDCEEAIKYLIEELEKEK